MSGRERRHRRPRESRTPAPTRAISPGEVYGLLGRDEVAALCDDFTDRVFADPALAAWWVTLSDGGRYRLRKGHAAFIASVLGGPTYAGPAMGAAHAGAAVTPVAFARVAEHLRGALLFAAGGAIPDATVEQVIETAAHLAPAIVTRRPRGRLDVEPGRPEPARPPRHRE